MTKEEAIKLLVALAKAMSPQVRATKDEHKQIEDAIAACEEPKAEPVPQ